MGHHSCCSKQKVRRGLWSPEEDEKLINYITTYGHGCWSSVPRQAGLQRCGKSCRLRWINYLRPDLKRGNFSHQEESLIVELHRTLGNRWAQIARHLPGRTDNEVKNFWNSSIKKKLVGDSTGFARNDHKLKSIVESSSEMPSIHMTSSISPLVSYQDQISAPVVHVSPSLDHDLLSQELSKEKDANHNAEWVVAPSEWSFEYPNHMPGIYDIHEGGFPSYCFQNNNSEATGNSFDQSSSSTLTPKLHDIIDMAEYGSSQNKGIEDVANASYFTSASYHQVGGPNEALDGMLYVDSIMTSSQSLLDHLHVNTGFPSNWEVKY